MIRTRFAPSPTGYMHIGNLRTALYSYLVSKNKNGKFILRIEDTDRNRLVKDSIDVIYKTLKDAKLNWDEGPDIGGEFAPYIQSERKDIYLKYAKQLIENDNAYYCFCPDCHSDLERYKPEVNYGNKEENKNFIGYNGHCRNLSKEEVEENLKNNKPYCIRQKIEQHKDIAYVDSVYGKITINTDELDDQVLIKQDGYPTYNFANVIDDHLMGITHIVRGNEYLSSVPKYNLLYEAFGWSIPTYIHLPLIMRKNINGEVEKLSKRNGSVSYEDFINNGYLSDAIINYIGLLGWSPKNNNEFLSLNDFIKQFNVKGILKSPAIFDEEKLKWLNGKYIRKMNFNDFSSYAYKFTNIKGTELDKHWDLLAKNLQNKISKFSEIPNHLNVFYEVKNHDIDMYNIERIGLNTKIAKKILQLIIKYLNEYSIDELKEKLLNSTDFTKAQILSTLRISLTGLESVVLDMFDIIKIINKENCVKRMKIDLEKIC